MSITTLADALLLQPKLNTSFMRCVVFAHFLHMPAGMPIVPAIAVRRFMSPIRGNKNFIAFGQEYMTDSVSRP